VCVCVCVCVCGVCVCVWCVYTLAIKNLNLLHDLVISGLNMYSIITMQKIYVYMSKISVILII